MKLAGKWVELEKGKTEGQTKKGREEQTDSQGKRKRGEVGLKGIGSECAQVLLVAAAEDASCQDPKGRPVQMPEHSTVHFSEDSGTGGSKLCGGTSAGWWEANC